MDSQLCIQALVVSLVLVKLTLLTSLFLYWRFQKTYHGFSLWILSFACSAGIQSLYFFRGVIADFWSVGIANILLILSMLLLFVLWPCFIILWFKTSFCRAIFWLQVCFCSTRC